MRSLSARCRWKKSPLTGGPLRQFRLVTPDWPLTAFKVHERFYGRSHLVFGWRKGDAALRVPWDHQPDYFAAAIDDAFALFGPGERQFAYALSWIVHVVSDSLIKSIQPGVDLRLLDGKYTARNRPAQDLVTFHELREKEFHLLVENRRYVRHHAHDVFARLQLHDTPAGPECSDELRKLTSLSYAEMLEAARAARFPPRALQIGEQIGEMFTAVAHRCPALATLPLSEGRHGTH